MAPAGSYVGNRMVTEDEGILIARSRSGDWEAFAALIRMHQRMIHSLAYRMTCSAADAEDLAQETFIRAYRSLDGYRGAAKLSSWLYRIALNLCLRWRRIESRRGTAELEWAGTGASESATDQGERVQEALLLLPAKQRAAVVLTVFDGMTHSEAAAVLGCLEKTVSWRLFAARRRLAQLLAQEEPKP